MSVSPAELEELEEVEGWVSLMAELEVSRSGQLPQLLRRSGASTHLAWLSCLWQCHQLMLVPMLGQGL